MEIEKVLDAEGVRGAVRYLNSSVPHHDTAVYEITEQILHNLYIFDKLNPKLKPIEDTPISESYCELVLRTSAPVKIVNAWADVMTRSHNAFPKAKAYCRYPLRDPDGSLRGTLCHFDPAPLPISELQWQQLAIVGDAIAKRLWILGTNRG